MSTTSSIETPTSPTSPPVTHQHTTKAIVVSAGAGAVHNTNTKRSQSSTASSATHSVATDSNNIVNINNLNQSTHSLLTPSSSTSSSPSVSASASATSSTLAAVHQNQQNQQQQQQQLRQQTHPYQQHHRQQQQQQQQHQQQQHQKQTYAGGRPLAGTPKSSLGCANNNNNNGNGTNSSVNTSNNTNANLTNQTPGSIKRRHADVSVCSSSSSCCSNSGSVSLADNNVGGGGNVGVGHSANAASVTPAVVSSSGALITQKISRTIPSDKINLRLILVSGKTKEFLFNPSDSAGDIAQTVFDNWPEDWQHEAVSKAEILRLIYQGRFLHCNVTLGALGLPLSKTTVMHLVPRDNLPEPNSQDQRQKSKGGSGRCCSTACCIL